MTAFAMVHLDASFLINALVPGTSEEKQLMAWKTSGEPVNIAALAWGEFLCGPLSKPDEAIARAMFPAPEPFTATDSEKAAALFNAAGRRSRSFADCGIAAVALRFKARLATSNVGDFRPLVDHGLVLA
jgi:predicted nucleic acid-binding protein